MSKFDYKKYIQENTFTFGDTKKINEATHLQITKKWLESFLKASGVEYKMFQQTIVINDDVREVTLKIMGSKDISED